MRPSCKAALLLVFSALVFTSARPTIAYTPESPEVRAIMDKAVAFLRSKEAKNGDNMSLLGGKALWGMAILKATHEPKDPDVVEAANYVAGVAKAPPTRLRSVENSQYSLGIALMFLASVDAQRYKQEISNLSAALVANQKPGGGWGYNAGREGKYGDTSQTQYGVMASWMALKTAKVPVSPSVFEKAVTWLMQTQKPNGSFVYQPGHLDGGEHTSISLTAAGAASALIAADALGILKAKERDKDGIQGLREVKTPAAGGGGPAPSTSISIAGVMAAVGRANGYFNGNFSWRKADSFYYFMYAMERYMTFREIAEGTGDNLEPTWYNQGVDLLKSQQAADGSFYSENGKPIATSFAILFLARSTKAAFEASIEGTVRGGYGLPKDVSTLREGEDGEVIGTEIKGALDDVLALIEQGDDTDYDLLLAKLKDVKIEKKDTRKRDAQMEQLRRKISSPNFGERIIAVRALSRENDLSVVPALIYALTDPDKRVAIEARDGLRFISRKFDGFGLVDDPEPSQARAAQEKWKAWLRSIRPNAKFIID